MKALVGPCFRNGSGITTYVFELAKTLSGMDIEVTMFGTEPRPPLSCNGKHVEWIPIGTGVGSGIAFLPLQIYITTKIASKLKGVLQNVDTIHGAGASLCVGIRHPRFILAAWSTLNDISLHIKTWLLTVRLAFCVTLMMICLSL